ncbi:Biotin-requiring enzyme [Pustulibacterium marinum]|uniref:Biotin-requiring enzyme n=1 Tax=Pustulibacterium marinum TaxID=1224947 RepID=A0A1I7INS8_9FLAO|nr:acetyl-CoA carboxylase biotin carboxyl carrier protein subunit [Pustulibacterium marinum]SFU74571.1 Biotin-requiring enzyme [Pustulibacterium marinum]
MSINYKTTVNGEFEFSLSTKDIEEIDTISKQNESIHLLYNHTSYQIKITEKDFFKKSYNVSVNGNMYSVHIEDDLDQLIQELGFDLGLAQHVNDIKAPMPGLILDVHVKPGDEVSENDPLLILEAMKMENVITSPRAGIIKSVAITTGNAVDKNTLLIEFES